MEKRSLRNAPTWKVSRDGSGICTRRARPAFKAVPETIDHVRAMLAAGGGPFDEQIFQRYTLGQLFASEGNMDEAIRQWEIAYESASTNRLLVTLRLQIVLGTAYLHRASMDDHTTQNGIDSRAHADRLQFR